MPRTLFIVVVACACGRAEYGNRVGAEGGRCYGNDTCNVGLVCDATGTCVSESIFSCRDVDCADRGVCALVGGRPQCICEQGNYAVGLACVSCPAEGCPNVGPCPPDMVALEVAGDAVCIDRYEAAAFELAQCSGAQYGVSGGDDYPVGFPDYVESEGVTGNFGDDSLEAAATRVYACSVEGVLPSTYLTWFQAKFACESSGKELCDSGVWLNACEGNDGRVFPYGPDYVTDVCNGADRGIDAPADSGSHAGCEGGYPGLFDMSGNIDEWTATCLSGDCMTRGGSYADDDTALRCDSSRLFYPGQARAFRGFRCCRPPQL